MGLFDSIKDIALNKGIELLNENKDTLLEKAKGILGDDLGNNLSNVLDSVLPDTETADANGTDSTEEVKAAEDNYEAETTAEDTSKVVKKEEFIEDEPSEDA